MSWREQAACRGLDTDLFFPGVGESVAEAKTVCNTCPVAYECFEDAIVHGDQHGIWGGTSNLDRRKIRRLWDEARVFTHPRSAA